MSERTPHEIIDSVPWATTPVDEVTHQQQEIISSVPWETDQTKKTPVNDIEEPSNRMAYFGGYTGRRLSQEARVINSQRLNPQKPKND